MPHTKGAKKRLRQSLTRRTRNRQVRSTVRTQTRRVHERLEAGDGAGAKTELGLATKKLDQAAAKGVIHKNTVSRLKSRLTRRLNKLQAQPTAG